MEDLHISDSEIPEGALKQIGLLKTLHHFQLPIQDFPKKIIYRSSQIKMLNLASCGSTHEDARLAEQNSVIRKYE